MLGRVSCISSVFGADHLQVQAHKKDRFFLRYQQMQGLRHDKL